MLRWRRATLPVSDAGPRPCAGYGSRNTQDPSPSHVPLQGYRATSSSRLADRALQSVPLRALREQSASLRRWLEVDASCRGASCAAAAGATAAGLVSSFEAEAEEEQKFHPALHPVGRRRTDHRRQSELWGAWRSFWREPLFSRRALGKMDQWRRALGG